MPILPIFSGFRFIEKGVISKYRQYRHWKCLPITDMPILKKSADADINIGTSLIDLSRKCWSCRIHSLFQGNMLIEGIIISKHRILPNIESGIKIFRLFLSIVYLCGSILTHMCLTVDFYRDFSLHLNSRIYSLKWFVQNSYKICKNNTKKSGAKTAPLFKSGAVFSLIIMFKKKTVPLTKVVPFAKTARQWSRFPSFFR